MTPGPRMTPGTIRSVTLQAREDGTWTVLVCRNSKRGTPVTTAAIDEEPYASLYEASQIAAVVDDSKQCVKCSALIIRPVLAMSQPERCERCGDPG